MTTTKQIFDSLDADTKLELINLLVDSNNDDIILAQRNLGKHFSARKMSMLRELESMIKCDADEESDKLDYNIVSVALEVVRRADNKSVNNWEISKDSKGCIAFHTVKGAPIDGFIVITSYDVIYKVKTSSTTYICDSGSKDVETVLRLFCLG